MKKSAPITKVCCSCGSTNVSADGYAAWNEDTQDWELRSVFDNTDCESCGCECRIDDRPAGFDPFSEGFKMDRIEIADTGDTHTVTHYPPGTTRGQGTTAGIIAIEEGDRYGDRATRARALATLYIASLPGLVATIERDAP